ncbi:YeiH family protein [Nonomuraea sp. KM88]|uniref:YeiH family protein n=1 Tax=Nonomuraea sp. KM88 TaxID=3457427 RepID=UPI003FCD30FB
MSLTDGSPAAARHPSGPQPRAHDTATAGSRARRSTTPGSRTLRLARARMRRTGSFLAATWPGVAVAALAVVFALAASRFFPALSPAVIAVASGAALANVAGIGERLKPGLAFVSRRVLRVAVALLGLQIALPQVLALGWQTLAVVVVATGVTFAVTPRIGRRLGLTPGTSLLVATGVSICGAAAIAAMHESSDTSDDDDAAGALGVVVLYGTAAIAAIPLLASLMGLSPAQLAVWTGAAVHEVAQVAAIGAASGVLATAVTVKLGRVLLLAPMVALFSGRTGDASSRPPVVPLFVVAFLAMVALRSTGQVPAAVTDQIPQVTGVLMAAALFGLGTGIDLRKLVKGGRVMLLGGIATAVIAAVSLAGVALLV